MAGSAELRAGLGNEREAFARKAEAAADKQKAADEKIFAGMRQFSAELEKRDTNMARSLQGIQAWVVSASQAAARSSPPRSRRRLSKQWLDWGKRVDDNAKAIQTWGHIAGDALNANAAEGAALL